MHTRDADRIARERALEKQRQEDAAQVAKVQQEFARLQSCVQATEQESSIILQLLAERGYPGVTEVHFQNALNSHAIERLLGKSSSKSTKGIEGGWVIGATTTWMYGENVGVPLYLLSDGRICSGEGEGGTAFTIGEWVNFHVGPHKDDWHRRTQRMHPSTVAGPNFSNANELLTQVLNGLRRLRSELQGG